MQRTCDLRNGEGEINITCTENLPKVTSKGLYSGLKNEVVHRLMLLAEILSVHSVQNKNDDSVEV